jgi:hypothetical protein
MYLNLVNYPFGVGFQNFGAIGMESLFRKVITLRSGAFGADSSLISSFLLSKLISEFGVFGIIFLFYYRVMSSLGVYSRISTLMLNQKRRSLSSKSLGVL